ncbi:MAG: DUF4224 domain-containing protein [Sulfuriflexus sp.]|nr:DUF4224 domain-containing protein [Sulfuriflexus sp.]
MNNIDRDEKPINLTKLELISITNKTRNKTQLSILLEMGIPCLPRPDGSPLVSRQAFEQAMGVMSSHSRKYKKQQPQFGSL